MREIRPGLLRVRTVRPSKLENIEKEITNKYNDNKEAVEELQGLALAIKEYVVELRSKGIDTNYINTHAEQITSIFFAVMELLKHDSDKEADQTAVEAIEKILHK